MTAERVQRAPIERRYRSPWPIVADVVVLGVLVLIVHNAHYGAVSPRIRNPNAVGLHPMAVRQKDGVPLHLALVRARHGLVIGPYFVYEVGTADRGQRKAFRAR